MMNGGISIDKRIRLNRFPGGMQKALTMSYDDGRTQDRRLVEIFNEHGIRGSFHLNSGFFGNKGYLEAGEVAALFKGHEVSSHTVDHPFLGTIPKESVVREIMEDRNRLEELVGYPVRGMSYPFGAYNDTIVGMLPVLGIEYSRTVHSHGRFDLPQDFLRWPATCHHNDKLLERAQQFMSQDQWSEPMLMYVWGHSYEFDNNHNWDMMIEFCKLAGRKDSIWYATNIEIVDYLKAVRNLKFSVSRSQVYNPSAAAVWITVDSSAVRLDAGSVTNL